jgi:hypothetical protein
MGSIGISEAAENTHKRKKKDPVVALLAYFMLAHFTHPRGGPVGILHAGTLQSPASVIPSPMPCNERILPLTKSGGFIQANYTSASQECLRTAMSMCGPVPFRV